ncbi:MAG: type II toxin-antitoxin system HicA family toxin [Cyanobacteria bacterium J06614_10]
MPRLKRLSGAEAIKILKGFGFEIHSQRGSHIKLRRTTDVGKETLTIPNHKQIDTGTLRAIMRQAAIYIPISELAPHFYDD